MDKNKKDRNCESGFYFFVVEGDYLKSTAKQISLIPKVNSTMEFTLGINCKTNFTFKNNFIYKIIAFCEKNLV